VAPRRPFDIVDGRMRPLLDDSERFSVVTTYVTPWWQNMAMRDPHRLTFARGICRCSAAAAGCCGSQNTAWTAPARPRARFLKKVEDGMRSL